MRLFVAKSMQETEVRMFPSDERLELFHVLNGQPTGDKPSVRTPSSSRRLEQCG